MKSGPETDSVTRRADIYRFMLFRQRATPPPPTDVTGPLLSFCAPLRFDIVLMKEGRMKGQAFVGLPSERSAERALRDTNGYVLYDKPLVVVSFSSVHLESTSGSTHRAHLASDGNASIVRGGSGRRAEGQSGNAGFTPRRCVCRPLEG